MPNRNLLLFRCWVCLKWLVLTSGWVLKAASCWITQLHLAVPGQVVQQGGTGLGSREVLKLQWNVSELSRDCAPGMLEKPVCCLRYGLEEPTLFLSWAVIRASFPGYSVQALEYFCCHSDICQIWLLEPFLVWVCLIRCEPQQAMVTAASVHVHLNLWTHLNLWVQSSSCFSGCAYQTLLCWVALEQSQALHFQQAQRVLSISLKSLSIMQHWAISLLLLCHQC